MKYFHFPKDGITHCERCGKVLNVGYTGNHDNYIISNYAYYCDNCCKKIKVIKNESG